MKKTITTIKSLPFRNQMTPISPLPTPSKKYMYAIEEEVENFQNFVYGYTFGLFIPTTVAHNG
jgi:hypothetical protein